MQKFIYICIIIFSFSKIHSSTLRDDSFENPNLLTIAGGVFNITKYPKVAMLQLEYKSTFTNFKKARPIYGAFITEKLSSYFYCGVGYDIFLGKYLVFTPSIAAGIYFQGNGKKLHYPLEFRSSAELCYVFKNKSRIGGQFYHISNASLGRKNPGVEALLLTYSFAL